MDKKEYRKVEKRVPAKNELILNSSSFLLTEILVNFQKVLFFDETFSLNKIVYTEGVPTSMVI